MSDSTTPGVLAPASIDHPENDGDLDAVIQLWVRAITGLPGPMVRPRWQPTPPPSPAQDVNWVALGCLWQDLGDVGHYAEQATDNTMVLHRHETMHYLLTFYGPNASGLAIRLRDGAMITQNRDMLATAGIAVTEFGRPDNTPSLTNEVFRGRCDLPVEFRRQIVTTFPVRSLLSAPLLIANNRT